MSSAGNTPPPAPAPSVFISYASEDRAAARALRDALAAVGLDVWYDENELTGGDAWDQKLRRQIRDCEYFMPVISATTERRKEGYFRREWRLAAERTLDMADDVLFIVPVTIDDTSEQSARVPDKFLTVQWLRAPGGQRNPALDALALRLLAGEHHIAPRRGGVTAPPVLMGNRPPPAAAAEHEGAPPMPHFPHPPEKGGVGHWLRFFAEILWWFVTGTWLLLTRLPRWMRIFAGIWVIVVLLGPCRMGDSKKPSARRDEEKHTEAEIEKAIQAAAQYVAEATQAQEPPNAPNAPPGDKAKAKRERDPGRIAAKIGEEMTRRYGGKGAEAVPKPLIITPFSRDNQDAVSTQFSQAVFSACYGHLILAQRTDALISPALPGASNDTALATLGKRSRADFVLGAHVAKAEDGTRALAVRLIKSADGSVAWSGDYPLAAGNGAAVGAKIAEAILPLLPPKK
jgi:hypothetical protein